MDLNWGQLSGSAELPTPYGNFKIRVFRDEGGCEHVILQKGELKGKVDVPVRIHSECLTSEVFHSLRCDCRDQLAAALRHIAEHGFGAVIYLRQEGRGIGLLNKIEAYVLQDGGLDTVEANLHLGLPSDARTYTVAARLLEEVLEVRSVRLLTNNPLKLEALEAAGINVSGRVPVMVDANLHNGAYLKTKRLKMRHLI
jgi:GTP cyclohydrolase II